MSLRFISRMIAKLDRAIANMAMRGTVSLINSGSKMQTLQVRMRGDELKDGVEHFEPYGFTSKAHAGSEAIFLSFGGDRSHTVAIVVADRRYRLKALEDGESALYDDLGQVVYLTREGIKIHTDLDIDMRGREVRIHANERLIVECNGHGEEWLPDRKNTWTNGAVPGSSNPIHPPEIP